MDNFHIVLPIPDDAFVSPNSRKQLILAVQRFAGMLHNIAMRGWPQVAERARECRMLGCTTCRLRSGCLVVTPLVSGCLLVTLLTLVQAAISDEDIHMRPDELQVEVEHEVEREVADGEFSCEHLSVLELAAHLQSPKLLRAALISPPSAIIVALHLPLSLLEGIVYQGSCPDPGLVGFTTFDSRQLPVQLSRYCFSKNLSPFRDNLGGDGGSIDEQKSISQSNPFPPVLLSLLKIGGFTNHVDERIPSLPTLCHPNNNITQPEAEAETKNTMESGDVLLKIQEALNCFWRCVHRDKERLSQRATRSIQCKATPSPNGPPCGSCTSCSTCADSMTVLYLEMHDIRDSSSCRFEDFTYVHEGVERSSKERKIRCQRSNALSLVRLKGLRDVRLLMDIAHMDPLCSFMVVLHIPKRLIVAPVIIDNPTISSASDVASNVAIEDQPTTAAGIFLWATLPHFFTHSSSFALQDVPKAAPKSRCCLMESCQLVESAFGAKSGLRLLRCSGRQLLRPEGTSHGSCTALYCSYEHQRMDWVAHNGVCGVRGSVI